MLYKKASSILLILGVLLINYPAVSTVWNNLDIAKDTNQIMNSVQPNSKDIVEAEEYNKTIDSYPITDPWLNKIRDDSNAAYMKYMNVLKLNSENLMGEIKIPSIKVDLPVYHDATDEVLNKGVGHLFGSDLPVGGKGNISILTGHTGLATKTMFDNLPDIKNGDAIYIDLGGTVRAWRVSGREVILPSEVSKLKTQNSDRQDTLLLITCTPYGINTHRLVIEAHRDLGLEKNFGKIKNQIVYKWYEHVPNWCYMLLFFDIMLITAMLVKKVKSRIG